MKRTVSVALALALCWVALPGPAQEESPGRQVPLLLQKPTLSKTHIAFAYADDLWVVPRKGGEARRLTSGVGVETDPAFSPDGKRIAFTGQYDGNQDVYVVSAEGGEPRRLTYHPGPDQVVGWTPDGKRVLFRSVRDSHSRYSQLYTIGTDGGLPDRLPLPMADSGSYSPDGKQIAYVPFVNHPRGPGANVAWKQYRGGRQPFIWVADLADSSVQKLPRKASNDFCPMWVNGKIYFLSDRDGRTTLYQHDPAARDVKRLIDNKGTDLRHASAAADAIVYEQPGGIHLYDLKTGATRRVPISVRGDLPGVRPRFVKLDKQVQRVGLSPTGARVVLEARGDVFTVPAAKGDVRNLTRTSGVAERDPAWSPDGKWIAYFSDESGEYQLHVRAQDGKGEVKKIQPGEGPSFFYSPIWSPDSKMIAYIDKKLNYWYVDVATGKSVKVDTNPYHDGFRVSPVWSPDGEWLAYARQLKSHYFAVFLYSLQTGKSHQVSDGMSDAGHVQFDRSGKYLYFTASTDSGPARSSFMSALNRPVTRSAYVVVLSADEKSPLARESDEEKPAEKPKAKGDEKKESKVKVKVDLEDIDQRILALPVPAKNYVGLMTGKAGTLFLVEAPEVIRVGGTSRGTAPPTLTLHRLELAKRRPEKVIEGIRGATISANGEKLLYALPDNRLCIAAASAAIKPGEGAVNLAALEVRVDPRAEWRQMYREVWRIQRDFLYDPGFHGLDLKKTAARYEPYLAGIASRGDLGYLFEEMLGDLALGHVYIQGGDRPEVKGPRGGLLGCDFRIDQGRYQFARIYRGENWNPDLRAPLTQPGARVKEGEYLLAVDGTDLKGDDSVYRLLEGKAGKSVTLKVAARADGTGAREVEVVPVSSDAELRHYSWVTVNRRLVDRMTGGKVAYVYLPNTHGAGHYRFNREFYAQVGKDAVIIDERFNGGGFLADQVIDALNQRVRNYVATREGSDHVHPRGIFGPKVMLINEAAGSGGDFMPYAFRQAKLGTLVGKRTWGGLVGIGGYPSLIDGGGVTAPHMAIWFPNGKWDVENVGVAPDVEVEFDPRAVRAGKDPQLEKAIEIVLEQLKQHPVKHPRRPAYPNYHQGGPVGKE